MNLVTKIEFAELCGVSPPAISQAIRNGKLSKALKDRKIDMDHPSAVSYMRSSRRVPNSNGRKGRDAEPEPGRPGPKIRRVVEGLEGLPEDIRKMADWSLRELVEMFGTDIGFVEWLNATRKLEQIHETRIKNAEKEGVLVRRDLVREGVLVPIDVAHKKLLSGGARSISRRVDAMVKSGREVEEIEDFIRERISSFIKGAKERATRTIESIGR